MSGRVRFTNLSFVAGAVEADVEILAYASAPPPPVDPPPVDPPPPPPPVAPLPVGYNSDPAVGLRMLETAMNQHGLTPRGVQGHGHVIADALNATWLGLDAYAHPRSDAVMWPGFGSLDVTIDSGMPAPGFPDGRWSFRPDGAAPWLPVEQR